MRLDLHIAAFPIPLSPVVRKGIYMICRRQYMTTSVSHCTDLNDTFLQLPKATQVILVESQDDLVISRLVYDILSASAIHQVQLGNSTYGTVLL